MIMIDATYHVQKTHCIAPMRVDLCFQTPVRLLLWNMCSTIEPCELSEWLRYPRLDCPKLEHISIFMNENSPSTLQRSCSWPSCLKEDEMCALHYVFSCFSYWTSWTSWAGPRDVLKKKKILKKKKTCYLYLCLRFFFMIQYWEQWSIHSALSVIVLCYITKGANQSARSFNGEWPIAEADAPFRRKRTHWRRETGT